MILLPIRPTCWTTASRCWSAVGLADDDLGEYVLGARIAVRMLVRGATLGRAVVAD
jgi:hypothetical protein